MLWIVLLFSFCTSSPLTVYTNAKFEPDDIHFTVDIINQTNSQIECACACFSNLMCLTATYFGINQRCLLFSAGMEQGILQIMFTNEITSVLMFRNKTLSDPSRLTDMNETVYGIWNTVAGGSSNSSTSVVGEEPTKAFDNSSTTKYSNYGTCDPTSHPSNTGCGENTGLYLSLQRGPSLLVAFQFYTANNSPANDPLLITIEGSNQPTSVLTLGSSWTLMYSGSSGLDSNPGRRNFGITQSLPNNSIWYTSYRVLVTSTRGSGTFVHYSELELLGY